MFQLFIASTRLKYSYVCQPIRHIDHKEELRVSIYPHTMYIVLIFCVNVCDFLLKVNFIINFKNEPDLSLWTSYTQKKTK